MMMMMMSFRGHSDARAPKNKFKRTKYNCLTSFFVLDKNRKVGGKVDAIGYLFR
jgi:hypothetical protein